MALGGNNLRPGGLFGGRKYTVLRIVCLVLACACIIGGALLLAQSTQRLSRSQDVAAQMIQDQPKADALVIASYDESDTATVMQRDGVVDVLKRSSVAPDVVYLNARGVLAGADVAATDMGRAISSTVSSHNAAGDPYAVVVAIDDEALVYAMQQHDSLFADTPVVFVGIEDESLAQQAYLAGYATGLMESYNVEGMLDVARTLQPRATKVLAVIDDTTAGKSNAAEFQAMLQNYPELEFSFVNATANTRDDLARELFQVGNDTLVFYLNAANDADGNAYSAHENAYFISRAASQPVYRVAFGGVGEGIVGSGYVDHEANGSQAADMAVSILNGTRPADIAVVNDAASASVFDTAVMANYGLASSELPGDAIVLGSSGGVWDTLKALIVPVLLLLLGVALIGIFTLLGYRRSISSMRDLVSQRNQLERSYYTDHLTDIPNMQWLTAYAGTDASSNVYSIVEVVLLDMADIAGSYGSEAADTVIKTIATRLDGLAKDFLVRTGETTFIVGFERALVDDGEAMRAIKGILAEPVSVSLENGTVTENIPVESQVVVFNRERGMSIQEMVAGVDLAVRQSKDHALGVGIGSDVDIARDVIFYDSDMLKAEEDKLEITATLKKALASDGFVVVYQPQVNLQTNDVVAYEALVRLKNGVYPPEQFIPVAETTGMIIEIGRIVAKKVIQQLASWRKRNKRMRPVSLNYSPEQLKDEGYVDYLAELLQTYDVSPSFLIVEISEVLFVGNMIKTNEFLECLKDTGIRLAIDDFGVGYTSISRVISIPADVVKIDRALTREYLQSGNEEVIQNLVRLVTDAHKSIVIEGVETKDQLDMCIDMSCDVVQGHYYAEPMLPERAVQYKPPKRS